MFGSWSHLLLDTNQSRGAALTSPGNVLSLVLVWTDYGKYHMGHTEMTEGHFSSCYRLVLGHWVGFTQKIIKLKEENSEIRFYKVIQNWIKAVHYNCHQSATSLIGYNIHQECRQVVVHQEIQLLRLQTLELILDDSSSLTPFIQSFKKSSQIYLQNISRIWLFLTIFTATPPCFKPPSFFNIFIDYAITVVPFPPLFTPLHLAHIPSL